MYNSQDLAIRIKTIAKERNKTIKEMLVDLNLGSNTMSSLYHGRSIAHDSLAKIADYLDCSTDYLLCRTDDPNGHSAVSIGGDNNNNGTQAINGNVSVTAHEKQPDSLTEQFLQQFDSLSFEDKLAIMQYVQDIKKSSSEGDD